MPRRPKNPHPLRAVRDATGLNQSKFAQAVQTSSAMVHAIEHRQRNITSELAQRLLAFTGVDPRSLEAGPAVDLNGARYTRDSFRKWSDRNGKVGREEKKAIEAQLRHVRELLTAAAMENRLPAALLVLGQIRDSMIRSLALDQRLRDVFEKSVASPQTYTVGELRRDRKLAKKLGFKDSPSLSETAKFRIRLQPENEPERHVTHGGPSEIEMPWPTTERPIG